jgi:hypothetical protein
VELQLDLGSSSKIMALVEVVLDSNSSLLALEEDLEAILNQDALIYLSRRAQIFIYIILN